MKQTLAILLLGAAATQATQAAPPNAVGERLVKAACVQCHTLGKGEPHGAGPALFGLIGREAGSAPGFSYSAAFTTALKGRRWDAALLERWLTDTQAVAPGNGMSYFEDDKKKRAEIVRFLQSLH